MPKNLPIQEPIRYEHEDSWSADYKTEETRDREALLAEWDRKVEEFDRQYQDA